MIVLSRRWFIGLPAPIPTILASAPEQGAEGGMQEQGQPAPPSHQFLSYVRPQLPAYSPAVLLHAIR